MKAIFAAVLIMMLAIPAVAANKREHGRAKTAEMHLLLNSFAAISDGHIERVLQGLRLMAVTDEVQSGHWEKIKPVLAAFAKSGIMAEAVWFAAPDGTYYSVEKGLTGLNLRNRPYFPRLMAGEEVIGYLVLSKSTGKRTPIIAYPVKRDGKVIGALGVSLSASNVSKMIDKEMALPENLIFYAMDKNGQIALHRQSVLIFAYPSDMGSKSLTKSVKKMLSSRGGELTYDFYGERMVVYKKSPLTGWVYVMAFVTGKPGQPIEELPPVLNDLKTRVSVELNNMDQDVAKLAKNLSGEDLKSSQTKEMLADLCQSFSYSVDCATIDSNGKMVAVAPKAYSKFEGKDISVQKHVMRLRRTKKPVLSNVFKTVEGVEAADLEYPVFSHGRFAGAVSLLFKPDSLLSHVIDPVLQGLPAESFVMQTDGRILYDPHKNEVGLNLFTAPVYKPFPQLIALGSVISKQKNGAGTYEYWQKGYKKKVEKDAHWATVGLYGTQWRLVVMHVEAVSAPSGKNIERPEATDNALRTLAKNPELKDAISGDDITRLQEILSSFFKAHQGLYSVQLVKASGVNLYGYPEENSLVDIDVKKLKTPSAKHMLNALYSKKESSFESTLVEGKTGDFLMVPIFNGDEYLGMIYTIRLKE